MTNSEAAIRRHIAKDLKQHDRREGFSLREKLVIAARKLAAEDHSAYLAGQITIRAEEEGTFWTSDFLRNFAEVSDDDLVRFDADMKVVEGSALPNPGVRFHLWIYRQRPEVRAIVHTHPPWASALSMLEEELVVAHMDAMMFHDNCAFLPGWPGLPVGDSEGEIISGALGPRKQCILLGHHGILTAGRSIEEAVYLAVMLENAARLQMRAAAAGAIRPVDPSLAPEARDFLLQDSIVHSTFDAWGRLICGPKS